MDGSIRVHERVMRRHPELGEEDVLHAWRNAFAVIERQDARYEGRIFLAIGADARGRILEVVASERKDEDMLVYHAMTPPSMDALREVGLR